MMSCGAKARRGGICGQAAGWGTDHPGRGRCRLHGGASAGRPPIHGRYSRTHRESLAAKARQFANDPAPAQLCGELAILRALLQTYLDRLADRAPTLADIQAVYAMIDRIGRLVERVTRILSATALTPAEVRLAQAGIADLLLRFIPCDQDRARLLAELAATLAPHGDQPAPW